MSDLRGPIDGHTPVLPIRASPEPSGLHPPLEGCDEVQLFDQAYRKRTRQSSAVAAPFSGWMFATQPEAEPWWEIDLGAPRFVERIALWLAPMARGTTVRVVAHAFHTPAGEPPPGSFLWEAPAEELPGAAEGRPALWISADTIARHVRVSLRAADGSDVPLLVLGAEILAARLIVDSLPDSYARAFTLFADRPLFAARASPGVGPFEITHRYREVWTAARGLAAALAEILEPAAGDERIFLGLCTKNRPEWVMGDVAAALRGYVVVPLSPDDSDERLAAILGRCPLTVILVEGDGDRFARLAASCPSLRLIVTCGPRAGGDGQPARMGFADLVTRGSAVEAPPPRPRGRGDLCTVLFTSGSSGAPKGAMRSHATVIGMLASYGVAQPAVHLSFQPLSHVSERMYLPAVLLHGGLIGFSGGGAHLLSDLRALEPTLIGSVPRLFEIVHAAHRRRLDAALAAAPDAPRDEIEARVLAESRLVLGSRLQGISVGSAPVSAEVLAFMRRCFTDIWVYDGYGTTEHGTITTGDQIRPNVEVKLVPVAGMAEGEGERGEIWVKTPFLIDGYYGDPEATRASLDAEGFFATGDLGERTASGGVRVIGRVKNVIKLGQGEFVAVDRVEAVLASCPLVDRIFVHPDATSSALLAVVVPRDADLAKHPDAARVIVKGLAEHGHRAGLAGYELPRAVLVEPAPFTVESGLLTASGKLARPVASARYAPLLAALAGATPVIAEGGSLAEQLAAVVAGVVGRRVDAGEPLHEGLGADSLAVAEVLGAARDLLGREIPLGAWFEARTIGDLARRLDGGPITAHASGDGGPERDLDLELRLIDDADPLPARLPFETVLLTGATGLLGAHLLEALAARTPAHVLCLVRAPSDEAASARVRKTLCRYAIPDIDPRRWSAMAADLAAPDLGLSAPRAREIAERADAILHAAATVSWLLPYDALRAANVLGTLEILRLAMSRRSKPVHFVSTISTAPAAGDETSRLSFARAREGGGYGLSKWMAENLVGSAAARGHPAAVYRPSMITGHSKRGIGNPDDYVHRYLRGCVASGRYLDREDERLDMTPVDFVAESIVALMTASPEGGGTYHLSNLQQSMTYRDLGRAMARAGVPCAPSTYATFRAEVALAQGSPLRPLAAYFPEAGFALHMGPWPAERSRAALAKLGVVCPPVDDGMIASYLAGLR